jgi:hypothetical protein
MFEREARLETKFSIVVSTIILSMLLALGVARIVHSQPAVIPTQATEEMLN